MKRTFAIWMIISTIAVAPAKAQNYLAYLDKKTAQQTSASNIVFPLSDFTVVINQNKPHLYWQTGASSDYNYFEVQRSEKLSTAKGPTGMPALYCMYHSHNIHAYLGSYIFKFSHKSYRLYF